jgi:hypothetical protein
MIIVDNSDENAVKDNYESLKPRAQMNVVFHV